MYMLLAFMCRKIQSIYVLQNEQVLNFSCDIHILIVLFVLLLRKGSLICQNNPLSMLLKDINLEKHLLKFQSIFQLILLEKGIDIILLRKFLMYLQITRAINYFVCKENCVKEAQLICKLILVLSTHEIIVSHAVIVSYMDQVEWMQHVFVLHILPCFGCKRHTLIGEHHEISTVRTLAFCRSC